jgi:cation transport regulator ChaB
MDGLIDKGKGNVVSRPADPAKLMTEMLNREVASLKEIIFTRLDGMDRAIVLFSENIERVTTEANNQTDHLKALHNGRFEGMDKAVKLLQDITDRIPETIDEKIGSLRQIQDEKFSSIQVQFKERDVRTDQSSKDSKVAVDAALQAAKEAVGEQNKSSAMAISKSEASVVKQIDQMGLLITTQAKAVDDKFSDIKDRLTRIEGKGEGKVGADTTHQASSSQIFTIISLIIAFVSVCSGIFIALHR